MGKDDVNSEGLGRKFVHLLDNSYVRLGELLRLPSATPVEEAPALPSTVIELPGGKKAYFKVAELKGQYDFEQRASVYKAKVKLGPSTVKVTHDVLSNMAQFEVEGASWEFGYRHADNNLHAKKKWQISRNARFTARQDVPHGDWASVPSPRLQLEHEVRSDRWRAQKLELKYDTFYQLAQLEEELRFGPFFKLKAAADSRDKLQGAKASLELEPLRKLCHEAKLVYTRKRPTWVELSLKPLRGIKLTAFADPLQKKALGAIEAQAERDGCKIELRSTVDHLRWRRPTVHISYSF